MQFLSLRITWTNHSDFRMWWWLPLWYIFVFLFFPTPSPVQAVYKTSDHCHYEGWIEPYYPEASLSVQRFYSWTGSFVRIEPLWKDLKCGQKWKIAVHYVLNTEGYERINTTNFYYVVSIMLWVHLLKGLYWTDTCQSSHRISQVSALHSILCPPFSFLCFCDQQKGPQQQQWEHSACPKAYV